MDRSYRSLCAANGTKPVAVDWFDQNETVLGWIRDVLPNTDDAWRSLLVWLLY